MFSKLGTWFSDLTTNIGNFFSQLFDNLGGFFSTLWGWLSDIVSYINPFSENFFAYKLLELLGDLLEWLFVPEENYFNNKVEEFKTDLNEKIPYQQYVSELENLENMPNTSRGNGDISLGIDLNNYSVLDKFTINMSNFIDFSIFSRYKETWYSWVRVVFYIGLVIFNINQAIKFLRGFGITEGSIRDFNNNVNFNNKGSGNQ